PSVTTAITCLSGWCIILFSCFFFFFQAEDGIRDDLVTGVQTCALPISFAGVEGWRWMLGLAVAPALIFGTGMFFLPETPRWLIRGGHHEVAHRVLLRIRDVADVNVEIEEIKVSLAQQTESGRWTDLLRRQVRPALFVGLGLA